ncbi:unnamed protein product [Arabidopsis halleri]
MSICGYFALSRLCGPCIEAHTLKEAEAEVQEWRMR